MRKNREFALLCMSFVICATAFIGNAQTFPFGINYQGLARDAFGNAQQNTPVPVQFTIVKGNTAGVPIWQERQVRTTNSMGQFNAVIGTGTPVNPFIAGNFQQNKLGF